MKNLNDVFKSDKNNKPDWKQWIPIYGIFKAFNDEKNDKPTIYQGGPLNYYSSMAYHIVTSTSTIIGLIELTK